MPLKLEDLGYKVGDLVTYNSDKQSTGGIIFVIAKNFDSPIPDNERSRWYSSKPVVDGKTLKPMEIQGYIRLRPVFEFFPTQLGANPKGAAGTVLVYHTDLNTRWGKEYMKKVDLITLGSKYAELGNLVRDVARIGAGGNTQEEESDAEASK